MPKTAFEAARKQFEAVLLASCRLLMKTLIMAQLIIIKWLLLSSRKLINAN